MSTEYLRGTTPIRRKKKKPKRKLGVMHFKADCWGETSGPHVRVNPARITRSRRFVTCLSCALTWHLVKDSDLVCPPSSKCDPTMHEGTSAHAEYRRKQLVTILHGRR